MVHRNPSPRRSGLQAPRGTHCARGSSAGIRWASLVACLVAGCAAIPPPAHRAASIPAVTDRRAFWSPAPRGDRPILAILMDDLGDSIPQAAAFLEVPVPLSFAILPDAPAAPDVARFLRSIGREVLVHLPMEPVEADLMPHPMFLTTSMDENELRERTEAFLDRVPGAAGANNHMGSRFTQDLARLQVVFEVLKARGLFFVDSRTTPATVAREAAARTGIRFAERTVFLDNDPSEASIEARLAEAVQAARDRGCALAIAHPRPETLFTLTRWARAVPRDVDVAPVSRLVQSPCQADRRAGSPSER